MYNLTILLGVFSGTGLVQFLVSLLIIGIVIYALKVLLDWLAPPIPRPLMIILWLIIAVIVIVYLVNRFAGGLNF